jgi:hypothetical protein
MGQVPSPVPSIGSGHSLPTFLTLLCHLRPLLGLLSLGWLSWVGRHSKVGVSRNLGARCQRQLAGPIVAQRLRSLVFLPGPLSLRWLSPKGRRRKLRVSRNRVVRRQRWLAGLKVAQRLRRRVSLLGSLSFGWLSLKGWRRKSRVRPSLVASGRGLPTGLMVAWCLQSLMPLPGLLSCVGWWPRPKVVESRRPGRSVMGSQPRKAGGGHRQSSGMRTPSRSRPNPMAGPCSSLLSCGG